MWTEGAPAVVTRKLALAIGVCALLAGCGSNSTHGATPPIGSASSPTAPALVSVTPEASMPKISPHGRELLAQARKARWSSVVLIVSTQKGTAERTAAALRDLGGVIEATDTSVDYVRVSVPLDAVDKATTLEGISAVDVDEPLSYRDPTP
jgi:hypothetical protein